MEKILFELFIDGKGAFLKNIVTDKLEYKIICIDQKAGLISIEAINYIDRKRMYIKDIDSFYHEMLKTILPECYF